MATLTIKNVPDQLYERLRERAAANRRSMNGEAVVCLERVLRGPLVDEPELLERVRLVREAAGVYLTETVVREAIGERRP